MQGQGCRGQDESTCEHAYSSLHWSRRAERATRVQEAKSKRDAERAAREAERAAKDAAVKATAQDAADALAAKAGDDAKAKSDDKADVKAEPSAKAEQANGQVRRGRRPDVLGPFAELLSVNAGCGSFNCVRLCARKRGVTCVSRSTGITARQTLRVNSLCGQQAMKEDKAAEPTGDAQTKKEAAVPKGEKADSDVAMKEAKVLPPERSCCPSVAEQVQAASLCGHFQ